MGFFFNSAKFLITPLLKDLRSYVIPHKSAIVDVRPGGFKYAFLSNH